MKTTTGTAFGGVGREGEVAIVRFSTQRVRPALSSASVAMLTSVRLRTENVESCNPKTEYEFLQGYPVRQHPQAAGRGPLLQKAMANKPHHVWGGIDATRNSSYQERPCTTQSTSSSLSSSLSSSSLSSILAAVTEYKPSRVVKTSWVLICSSFVW